jgi:hypothetical protein
MIRADEEVALEKLLEKRGNQDLDSKQATGNITRLESIIFSEDY